ncbi:leucine-rich repeat domain-containing protein [Prevotellamassilia timonensis]|uniref:leucine-rich repeat domain-containing protein n=1 Tax=Prevotellamassilia timonensis TaxID=1852370 RepID=UPI004028AC2F
MKFTFNKQFMVLMFLLLNCFASYAANEDLITKQITLKLTEAGTLPDAIGSSKKYLVTNLKIIGEINGTDLRFIREMAGCDVKGYRISGNLSVLDLSEARFVAGGDSYYDAIGCYTSNDIMGKYAFCGCRSLKSVNIPSSVTEIGDLAFRDCSSLTSVNIPSSVTSIEESTFSGCSSLTSVNIPSSVTYIGDGVFSGCSSLINVNIPSSVTRIEGGAFFGCSSLTSVNIPSSVTSIGEWAFDDCRGLRSVYVYAETAPAGIGRAFEQRHGLYLENCTLYVPKGTYDAYCWLSELECFGNIVEFDATNIRNIVAEPEVQKSARYAVNGQRLTAPVKGINLVKYNNGRVKKEIVK